MFRRKTLKRLTRLGLCLYAAIYCMAFTVCAEPNPLPEMSVQNTFAAEEVSEIPSGAVMEEAVFGEDISEELPSAERKAVSARKAGGESTPYVVNVSFTTTWDLNDTISYYSDKLTEGIPVVLNLENDLLVNDEIYIPSHSSSRMSLTINGNGHKIQRIGGDSADSPLFYVPPANGGGVMNLVIANCTIDGGNCYYYDSGGAVYVRTNNSLALQNVVFEGNSARNGGAVCFNNSNRNRAVSFTIENCTFRNNAADDYGGAVSIEGYNTSLRIRNSGFYNNTCEDGGGAVAADFNMSYHSDNEISDCVFVENSADDYAGAVLDARGGIPHLNRNAFIANRNRGEEGVSAVRNDGGGDFHISNSVFFGNTGGEDMIGQISSPYDLGYDVKGQGEEFSEFFDVFAVGSNWYGNTAGNYSKAPVINGSKPFSWYWLNLTGRQFDNSYGVEVDLRNLYWGNRSAARYHNTSGNVGEDCALATFTLECGAEGAVLSNSTVEVKNGYGIIYFEEKPEGPYNLTLSVPGTDEALLTKEFESLEPDEGSGGNAVTVNKAFGDLDLSVTYNMTIPYTGIKLKPKNVKETEKSVYSIEDLTILLSSLTDPAFLDRTVPKFKFYNSKNVIPAGKKKQSYFTITLNPDPKLSKEEKKTVKKRLKNINKALKKEKFVFVIEPLDLAAAENPALQWNKKGTKVPKLTASWKGRSHVLKQKKDYTAEIKDKEVKLTGKGNFAGERVMAR